jgi:hypothetical protein
MVGAFLDPRTKHLYTFGPNDKKKIHAEVKRRAIELESTRVRSEDLAANAARQAQVDAAGAAKQAAATAAAAAAAAGSDNDDGDDDDDDDDEYAGLFKGLHHPPVPQQRLVGQVDRDAAILLDVNKEMLKYTDKAAVDRMILDPSGELDENGKLKKVCSNPLDWWRDNATTFPILSVLARITLCIPASSAPVERLFSYAGLTIANDRASLLPENAAEIIFLRTAWPQMEEINRKKRKRQEDDALAERAKRR